MFSSLFTLAIMGFLCHQLVSVFGLQLFPTVEDGQPHPSGMSQFNGGLSLIHSSHLACLAHLAHYWMSSPLTQATAVYAPCLKLKQQNFESNIQIVSLL